MDHYIAYASWSDVAEILVVAYVIVFFLRVANQCVFAITHKECPKCLSDIPKKATVCRGCCNLVGV
jgi:hypothetical protein